ncbi:transcriptional regulator, partial [Butyricicoccus sp. 1XD8-22]
ERLVILSEEEVITEIDLPHKMIQQDYKITPSSTNPLPKVLEEIEKELIIDAIKKGKSTRNAAKLLGVSQSYIMRKVKKFNIQLEEEYKTVVKM